MLISATPIASLTAHQTAAAITRWTEEGDLHLDASAVTHGVREYRLVYSTVATDGTTPTTASGLVVVPDDATPGRPVVAWEHGTTVFRGDAPSTGADSDARRTALLFAGTGSVTVAPDYLGLGVGPGLHPFDDRASEVMASIDLLGAAETFTAQQAIGFGPRVQVAGFSQGGTVAVAVGKALQDGAVPGLELTAVAGISGPYDLQHAQVPKSPTLDPYGVSFYLAYSALAWNRRFGLFDRPSQVFRAPYDHTVPPLFDGDHTQEQVFAGLATPNRMFTRTFLARVRHPAGGLLEGLRASDGACRWAPAVPIRLYATPSDEQVAYANTRHCAADFRGAGVRVPVVELGRHTHFGSAILGSDAVVRWFAGMR